MSDSPVTIKFDITFVFRNNVICIEPYSTGIVFRDGERLGEYILLLSDMGTMHAAQIIDDSLRLQVNSLLATFSFEDAILNCESDLRFRGLLQHAIKYEKKELVEA